MRARVLLLALALRAAALAATVTFHGGAGQVGGSSATVRSGAFKVLVDCGSAFDGAPASCGFPFDPKGYGDVLLTHAHQDHAGRVPELFNAGFTGTVWTTEATCALLAVAWKSQIVYDACAERDWRWTKRGKKAAVRVHWRGACEWAQKIAPENLGTFRGTFAGLKAALRTTPFSSGYPVACSTCQDLELRAILAHVRTVPFGRPFALGPFQVAFTPVKHLPGAAAIRLEDASASLLFSGDLGTVRSRLVKAIEPAARADAVFVEATYGDAPHGTPEETARDYARFREVVAKTVRAGGVAWIPAFALDRSQRVLLEVKRGMDAGAIPPETPVYVLSPSARAFTALYVEHPGWFDVPDMAAVGPLFRKTRKSFSPKAKLKAGAILLTTSGSMDMGASLRLAPELLPRATTAVCLVGYQSPGTCGFQLKAIAEGRAKKRAVAVRDGGARREIPVAASVHVFGCFSGHGDARENDAWLANNRASRIFLVHGDRKSLAARAEGLRARFGCPVEVVEPNRDYEIRREEQAAGAGGGNGGGALDAKGPLW